MVDANCSSINPKWILLRHDWWKGGGKGDGARFLEAGGDFPPKMGLEEKKGTTEVVDLVFVCVRGVCVCARIFFYFFSKVKRVAEARRRGTLTTSCCLFFFRLFHCVLASSAFLMVVCWSFSRAPSLAETCWCFAGMRIHCG